MNIQNIKIAIDVMERVEKERRPFDMTRWQQGHYDSAAMYRKYAAHEHECKMAACFGGWLALSPEWQSQGGHVMYTGAPYYRGEMGADAIAAFLEVSEETAVGLAGLRDVDESGYMSITMRILGPYYGKSIHEITVTDVLAKLRDLLRVAEAAERAEAGEWEAIA